MIADLFWFGLWALWFATYICAMIFILSDLYRDTSVGGGVKAVWTIFLIFVPFITAIIYLIARGSGIAARTGARRAGVAEVDDYRPSASSTPASDIAMAKELLDAGTISQGEFDALKSKALGNQYFGA